MSEERAKPVDESVKPAAHVSTICPDDLGLKAGFLVHEARRAYDLPTYCLGWVTVTNFIESALGPFIAIVLNDNAFPTFLSTPNFPNYVGVFAKALTPEEAKAKCLSWHVKTETGAPRQVDSPAGGPGGAVAEP